MMRQLVLLSAGLDSTVNLYLAREKGEVGLVLTFHYGQRAAGQEVERSRAICAEAGVPHEVLALPWLGERSECALTRPRLPLPLREGDGWVRPDGAINSAAEQVWVPNRNGVFVNVAAALAEAEGMDLVVAGFNAEEAAAFPDNSAAFVERAGLALELSTRGKVRLKSYTLHMAKAEIAREGERLGIPWKLLWSCYNGGGLMCGRCESCARLLRALRVVGLEGRLVGMFRE